MRATFVLDPGSSLSKIPYEQEGDSTEFPPVPAVSTLFLMGACVTELTEASYKARLDMPTGGASINNGLVRCLDRYFQIGNGGGNDGRERKFEDAIAKTLAALGYIACQVAGTDQQIDLTLGLLLPFDEYSDREIIQESIQAEVERFEYNGAIVDCFNLQRVKIVPEGYGLFRAVRSPEMGCLIVGHRDASYLYVENGAPIYEECSTFSGGGFRRFLRHLNFPVKDELKASQAIASAMASKTLKQSCLDDLLQLGTERERESLTTAIASARDQYALDLTRWLHKTNVEKVGTIAVSGGGAYAMQQELKRFLGNRLDWCADLQEELRAKHDLQKNSPMLYRTADPCSFAQALGA